MVEVHLVPLRPDDPALGGRAEFAVTSFPCVLGRGAGCGRRLADPLVSRQHCELSLRGGRVWVEDLVSRNGTFLNGERLEGARPLADGDRLDLADCPFQARLVGSPAEGAAPEAGSASQAGGPRRVLVVEDDETTAGALALLLKPWGHEVRVARGGPEALRAARERPPDTVFLDLRLPGMSGVDVARRLRRDAGLGRARLVALAGDEGATEALGPRDGFAGVLVKPLSSREVREALGRPG
jgi:CheY-like chemotaxis protein